jgi:hypothetical protein
MLALLSPVSLSIMIYVSFMCRSHSPRRFAINTNLFYLSRHFNHAIPVTVCRILGSHSCDHEELCLLVHNAV